MKIAVLSDIHGNAVALEAVLLEIDAEGVDSIICLGDVATLGPEPSRAVALLAQTGCQAVVSNHEQALLSPERMTELDIADELHSSLRWCREQLSTADMTYLGSFSETFFIDDRGEAGRASSGANAETGLNSTLLAYHGTPRSVTGKLLPGAGSEELQSALGDRRAQLYAGGHIHQQFSRTWGESIVLNPGSVGCPFSTESGSAGSRILPWAEYAIVTFAASLRVDLRRVDLPLERLVSILEPSELPI